jgi:hypothetical protein
MALLSVVEFLKSVMTTNLHHQSCQAFVVVGFGAHCILNRKTLGGVLGARSQGVLNSGRCNLIMVRVFLSTVWYTSHYYSSLVNGLKEEFESRAHFCLISGAASPNLMCLGAEYNSSDTKGSCRQLEAVHDRMGPCKVRGASAKQPRSDTDAKLSVMTHPSLAYTSHCQSCKKKSTPQMTRS